MDVFRWPAIGPFLKWRHARTTLQLCLLGVAALVVVHGFVGPDIGSANLSTVATWVHYRGLLVIALLAAGNLFCTGCPFIRVRDWGRRLRVPTRVWPSWLRGKWVALVLFVAVLFAYELFDLWALPRATAWLILGYFGAAFVIDLTFKGASFCKHVCPIGQFSFIASTMSPLEMAVREPSTCDACRTHDCIAGRKTASTPPVLVQRGCELGLFLPQKIGNLDCTFCFDCVQACPHDNIGLSSRTPGLELHDDRRRSGIGFLNRRADIAALVVVFVFGGLLNAFAMTSPAYRVETWMSGQFSFGSTVSLAAMFLLGLGLVPATLLGAAALMTPSPAGDARSRAATAASFVYGLVPLGSAIWMAHYGFHLATGILVVVPVLQSAAMDVFGSAVLGMPLWRWAGMRPGAVFPIQMGVLVLGTFGSLALMQLIARRDHPVRRGWVTIVWTGVTLAVAAAAFWIMFQPMEMRGTGL